MVTVEQDRTYRRRFVKISPQSGSVMEPVTVRLVQGTIILKAEPWGLDVLEPAS